MNPVLLKPESETGAQVIVRGKRSGTMRAADYGRRKAELLPRGARELRAGGRGHGHRPRRGRGQPGRGQSPGRRHRQHGLRRGGRRAGGPRRRHRPRRGDRQPRRDACGALRGRPRAHPRLRHQQVPRRCGAVLARAGADRGADRLAVARRGAVAAGDGAAAGGGFARAGGAGSPAGGDAGRSPCRRCRGSPTSTISIRCGRSRGCRW